MSKGNENINLLINNLVMWIDRVNLQNIRYFFSSLKKQLIQSKIKKIPKYNNLQNPKTQEIQLTSYPKQHSTNISYVSIRDFKPILDNYSSIKLLGDQSNSSDSNNYVSNLSVNYMTINQQTINYKKLSFKNHKYNVDQDKIDKDKFLQNWMIRQNSDFYLFQQYPKSNYCFKKIKSYHQQALDSIKKYSFDTFCQKNIKPQGFWLFKSLKKSKYSKTILNDSLIYLNQVQIQKSLQINENLLKAGGQIQSQLHYIFHIQRILQILIDQSDDLIQQSYLQIIKQLQSKKLIYMQILCVFSCCIKPAARLYLPLLNYLVQQESLCTLTNNYGISQEHYNYCFFHLIKNFDEPRKNLPSLYQIRCFMNLKKIPLTISFPKEKIFYIQSYTKVQQLFQQLINFYDLDIQIQYLLLINGCFLHNGILLDKLNCYQNKNIHTKWKQYQKFKSYKTIIVLKNMNDYKKSKRCFNIMYNYYINQYLKGLFPLKQKQIIQIAAMIIHSEIIDQENYNFDFSKIISARLRRKIENSSPQEKNKCKNYILDIYFKFNGTKIQARKKIVEILSTSKGYMTHFFKCSVFFDQLQQEENWVGIKTNKLIFIDPQNGRFIRQIYYSNISEWGSSKSQLCIKVDKLGILHIDTLQAQVLTSLFETYLNHIYIEHTQHQCVTPKVSMPLQK